jgi:hypothetical protein
MLSLCALSRLRFFHEVTIEAGIFWTFETNAGPQGDVGTMYNTIHFSYFHSTLNL